MSKNFFTKGGGDKEGKSEVYPAKALGFGRSCKARDGVQKEPSQKSTQNNQGRAVKIKFTSKAQVALRENKLAGLLRV